MAFAHLSAPSLLNTLMGVVDDTQMTTTLICPDLQLLHHFIEGTDIDTTDINSGTSGICTVQLLVLLPSEYK
jgi:hypothetical protein